MNVVEFFRQQVNKWNIENKCGYCWEFDAPLRDSDANESLIKTNECCVRVMITNYSFRKNRTFHPVNGLVTDYNLEYTFTLNVVIPSIIDRNVYNEQEHPISESKWATILEPLQGCLDTENPYDFCEILGRDDVTIISENWIQRLDWLDNNYDGWAITMTLKDKNPNSNIPIKTY